MKPTIDPMTTETQGAGLMEELVKGVLDIHSHRGNRHDDAVVALCDHWLSTRPSPQAGAIKLPVRANSHRVGVADLIDADGKWLLVCHSKDADAIVRALNNSGGA